MIICGEPVIRIMTDALKHGLPGNVHEEVPGNLSANESGYSLQLAGIRLTVSRQVAFFSTKRLITQ
jgi:hypothetical protein